MKKKAQGMSINVIIIAAIALIVLVVLVAVFTGRFGMFTKGVEQCDASKGKSAGCVARADCNPPDKLPIAGTNCERTEGQICCIDAR